MDNFVRNIRKKIVEVEVTGRPEEGEPEAPAATTSSGRDIKVREAPVTERPARPAGRISVCIVSVHFSALSFEKEDSPLPKSNFKANGNKESNSAGIRPVGRS